MCLSPQTISIPVFILRVGVDFSLNFQVNNQLSFPADGNSVDPVKLAVEVRNLSILKSPMPYDFSSLVSHDTFLIVLVEKGELKYQEN